MQKSKAERYIDLCRKAGKLVCGFNAIGVQHDRIYLLLLCGTASENAKKDALKLGRKFHCEILISEETVLEDVVGKENCKLAAITDENLAKAIRSSADKNYRIYSGGNI